jgi:hypothetical protein
MTAQDITVIFFFVVSVFLIVLAVISIHSAYRNGVRDGYQNTYLPHVKEQILQEGLHQGEEVKWQE